MKLKSIRDTFNSIWSFVKSFLPIFWRLAFLILGYWLLSPYCYEKIKVFLSSVDCDIFVDVVLKVVPTVILLLAIMFVLELFISYRLWLRLICLILGFSLCFVIWRLNHQELKIFYHFYDAIYASFTLVFLAGFLASILYSWFRTPGVKALVLIGFIILGSLLYEWLAYLGAFNFHDSRWLRPEQILVCIFGVIDKQKDIADTPDSCTRLAYACYYLFHALLAFFFGYIIIGVVCKAAVNVMLLRFLGIPDNVFWGVNSESIVLAKSLKERGEKCVFVISNLPSDDGDISNTASTDSNVLDQLSKEGFLWVQDGGILRMVAKQVEKHFFLSRTCSRNVELATELATYVEGKPDVYVVIDDEADDSWLFKWADRKEIREKTNIHILRETSLVSDLLLRDHPMLLKHVIKNNGNTQYRLIFIGFGAQGRMLLNGTICDAQVPGVGFEAVIVDKDQSKFDLYKVRCPGAVEKYGLSPQCLDVSSKNFFDWLNKELGENNYSRIIISTSNDDLNLSVAKYIINFYREMGDLSRLDELEEMLFVRVRNPENYADFNVSEKQGDLDFTPFGADKEVYSYQSVINLDIEKVARKINFYYTWKYDKNIKNEEVAWHNSKFLGRESSRASAMGIKKLFRLSGVNGEDQRFKYLEGKIKCPPNNKRAFWESLYEFIRKEWDIQVMKNDIVCKRLADAEHLRWMAFHYVRGFKVWDPKAQPEIEQNALAKSKYKFIPLSANQSVANRHAALIPTDDLFSLDIYLDVENFKYLGTDNPCFKFYADELNKELDNKGHLIEEDLTNENKKELLALNRLTFALWDAHKCFKEIEFIREKLIEKNKEKASKTTKNYIETIDKLLKKYHEYLEKLSSTIKEAYNDKELDKIASGLTKEIKPKIKTMVSEIGLFQRACRKEMKDVLFIIEGYLKSGKDSDFLCDLPFKPCIIPERFKAFRRICCWMHDRKLKTSNHCWQKFQTLGNLVGNDYEIVDKVPEYLIDFLKE